jgi:predicted small secreted protein
MKIRLILLLLACSFVLGGCPTPEGKGSDEQDMRGQVEPKPDTNPAVKTEEPQPSGARGGR